MILFSRFSKGIEIYIIYVKNQHGQACSINMPFLVPTSILLSIAITNNMMKTTYKRKNLVVGLWFKG